MLPTELMSKPKERTALPPSSTLRIYNHVTKRDIFQYIVFNHKVNSKPNQVTQKKLNSSHL